MNDMVVPAEPPTAAPIKCDSGIRGEEPLPTVSGGEGVLKHDTSYTLNMGVTFSKR